MLLLFMPKTYPFVEDYLEIIAGLRDIEKGTPIYGGFKPIINLARYDTDVLNSMSTATLGQSSLTEKQATLATKIILKYARQLAAQGLDVAPVANPQFRRPLRKMDYTRRLSVENDVLVLKFPFEQSLVDNIRELGKTSQGFSRWVKERKQWEIALTEYNLNWIYEVAKVSDITIAPEVEGLMGLITEVEKQGYKIELNIVGDKLEISNAAPSLIAYIDEHCGGFDVYNLLRLVDMAPILNYTVSSAIGDALIKSQGTMFFNMCNLREFKLGPGNGFTSEHLESVVKYATITNRFPIVFYEPDLSGKMLAKLDELYPGQVINNAQVKDPPAKFIHIYRPMRSMERIPLLVTTAGMVHGGDKQLMFQQAEKVIYFAAEVYNNKNVKVPQI